MQSTGKQLTGDFVAQLWAEVLKVPVPAAGDDFFALGGHSLAAMTVVTAVEQSYGIELDENEIWDYPTLAEFTARVEELVVARPAGPGETATLAGGPR